MARRNGQREDIKMRSRHLLAAITATSFAAALVGLVPARAQVQEPVMTAAQREKAPLLDTLKELVSIESGSRDLERLARLANLIAGRLNALGGEVELTDVSGDMYRMEDTPERVGKVVKATFKGTGSRKILLIAHMDTVYQCGMLAAQPFSIDIPVSSGRRNSWMEGGCDGGSAAFGSGPAGSAEVAGAAGGSAA